MRMEIEHSLNCDGTAGLRPKPTMASAAWRLAIPNHFTTGAGAKRTLRATNRGNLTIEW